MIVSVLHFIWSQQFFLVSPFFSNVEFPSTSPCTGSLPFSNPSSRSDTHRNSIDVFSFSILYFAMAELESPSNLNTCQNMEQSDVTPRVRLSWHNSSVYGGFSKGLIGFIHNLKMLFLIISSLCKNRDEMAGERYALGINRNHHT